MLRPPVNYGVFVAIDYGSDLAAFVIGVQRAHGAQGLDRLRQLVHRIVKLLGGRFPAERHPYRPVRNLMWKPDGQERGSDREQPLVHAEPEDTHTPRMAIWRMIPSPSMN